jgi:hypothetical protein
MYQKGSKGAIIHSAGFRRPGKRRRRQEEIKR